jgi:hypothetical protein
MKPIFLIAASALLIGAVPAKKLLTPNDIVAQAPASAWKTTRATSGLPVTMRPRR